jgi:ferredoxin
MSEQLRVNPTACTGHRLCAELLPERVILDEWGYPGRPSAIPALTQP